MGKVILITKENCKNCDFVKSKIPDGLDVTLIDGRTTEGMSYLAMYERFDGDNTIVPVLIVEDEGDDGSYIGTIAIKNKMLELVEDG